MALIYSRGTLMYNSCCNVKLANSIVNIKLTNKCSANHSKYTIRLLNTDVPRKKSFQTYDDLMQQRRQQAKRSVLIQVQSDKSCSRLYEHCLQFGVVNKVFHYTTQHLGRHFVFLEFQNEEVVKEILSSATFIDFEQSTTVQSSMLWFRNIKNSSIKNVNNTSNFPIQKNSTKISSQTEIYKLLQASQTVSEQIQNLYNILRLNDAGTRLRFFAAHQIEKCFHGLFPYVTVLPFGSSVNGFGKQGCDLDLLFSTNVEQRENVKSRLVFQSKSVANSNNSSTRQTMEYIADTMDKFMPGITHVRRILGARVPIIKFDQLLTGTECDLSMTNLTAHYMSELLYLYGEIDSRLRPMTFAVRKWAQAQKLTHKSPGGWITNFSLSLMVIFYLQTKKILPSLNFLKSLATKSDTRVADICVDCTFLRDITCLPKVGNDESLEELLFNFFVYYANFDFENTALSLREGKPVPKSEHASIFIFNPLEVTLNVSKNVRIEELQRIKVVMQNAASHLETEDKKSDVWGLTALVMDKISKDLGISSGQRRIDLSHIFNKNTNKQNNAKKDVLNKRTR